MSGPDSITQAMTNGLNSGARMPTNSAELVGSQFVTQFYTILHSSPQVLHRFYTDESTVTHADGGSETDGPSSVTVTTQKNISDRVQAMGFQEATTEIWSVDSQYSKDNGVMVLVTGSLQCKGKKKRDFVQSFFLAVQDKGYFVLNDTFRYLSLNHPRHNQTPKENGYHQNPYESRPYSQSPYHQQTYYPGQAQPHNPQAGPSIYTGASGYTPLPPVAPATATQSRTELPRGHAVTPSMLPSRPIPQPPKPVGPSSQPPQQTQPEAPTAAATSTTAAAAATAGPEVTPQAPSVPETAQPSSETRTAPVAAQEKPKPETASKPAETEQAAPTSVTQLKAVAKPEVKEVKPERPAQPAPPKEPSAPLTYADRLKLGSKTSAPKSTAAPSPIAPPPSLPATAQASIPAVGPPKPVPSRTPEPASESLPATTDAGEPSSTGGDGGVTPLPDDTLTTSIFVRSLPEGVTQDKLEEAFARFGNIKTVSLRQQPKGKADFAFVEFEEVAAMQAAIEAKVIIDGKTMTVMERKPMLPKHRAPFQGERGGRGEGRGFRGRDNRGRSRGEGRPYTGGRGDRGEGREGGRGRSYSGNFNGEPRLEGSKPAFEGRTEGGRGRGEGRGRGRNSNRAPQPGAQTPRPEQA